MTEVWLHHPNLPGQDIKVARGALGTYAMSGWQVRPDQADPVDPDLTVDDAHELADLSRADTEHDLTDDTPTAEDR